MKTSATQTDLTKEKNCLPSKADDASLSSVQDLVTFARNIPDLMGSLPVSVVIDDESLSETITNQLTGILHRYSHDLEKTTYIHTYIYFLLTQVGLRQPKGWWGPARKLKLNTKSQKLQKI